MSLAVDRNSDLWINTAAEAPTNSQTANGTRKMKPGKKAGRTRGDGGDDRETSGSASPITC